MKQFWKEYKECVWELFMALVLTWKRIPQFYNETEDYLIEIKDGLVALFWLILTTLVVVFGPLLALLSPIVGVWGAFSRMPRNKRQVNLKSNTKD